MGISLAQYGSGSARLVSFSDSAYCILLKGKDATNHQIGKVQLIYSILISDTKSCSLELQLSSELEGHLFPIKWFILSYCIFSFFFFLRSRTAQDEGNDHRCGLFLVF